MRIGDVFMSTGSSSANVKGKVEDAADSQCEISDSPVLASSRLQAQQPR